MYNCPKPRFWMMSTHINGGWWAVPTLPNYAGVSFRQAASSFINCVNGTWRNWASFTNDPALSAARISI
jgi:hypothetical protein